MKTVLVVDDDPEIRELLDFKLTAAGFVVRSAPDGEAGLAAAEEMHPDVILLDWMMPRLSGIDMCLQLRQRPKFRATPVIMLTAKALESDVQRGLSAGADDYITKPFSPREAVLRIEAAICRTRRARLPIPAPAAPTAEPVAAE
jgi:two-component system phosphate regulon response regulator PhoB